jgi:hypothetical protein
MVNPAFRGLVKIGRTSNSTSTRAQKLKSTGVPGEFIVVYDELVSDSGAVERRLHERFRDSRYQQNREFFQIPIREAIRGLIEEASGFVLPPVGATEGVEILPDLKRKYPSYLRAEFCSIKIVHREGVVYLGTVRSNRFARINEVVERTDLAIFAEDDIDMHPMFQLSRSPNDNARLFVHQLDAFDVMQCTDLFTQEACDDIARARCGQGHE